MRGRPLTASVDSVWDAPIGLPDLVRLGDLRDERDPGGVGDDLAQLEHDDEGVDQPQRAGERERDAAHRLPDRGDDASVRKGMVSTSRPATGASTTTGTVAQSSRIVIDHGPRPSA